MASKRALIPAKHLFTNFRATQSRALATEAPLSADTTPPPFTPPSQIAGKIPNPFLVPAPVTLYTFPTLEPHSTRTYPSTHLLLPVRKDILHAAVIFEGDAARLGTASTKYRSEIHGSGRKIRPQKGSGSARLGDKKSPMLKGGGVAFGPHPRDFSTELNRKVYDLAFRTAISARYQRGELLVVEGGLDMEGVSAWSLERFLGDVLKWNGLNTSMMVCEEPREELFGVLESSRMARGKFVGDVDVKDLLSGKGLVIERGALERLFRGRQSDLGRAERWKREEDELEV